MGNNIYLELWGSMDFNRFLLNLDTFANADPTDGCWLPLWSGEIFQLVT